MCEKVVEYTIFIQKLEIMWPFKKKNEIDMMISKLEILNSIPDDEVMKWENSVSVYHQKVDKFFSELDMFWSDSNYVENIERLHDKDIAECDIDEIKTIITKLWRHERFCYGSWAESIKSGIFNQIQSRLVYIQKNYSSQTVINVTRDSVSMGDDVNASHEYSFVLDNDATINQLLDHLSNNNYLASIAGKDHSWEAIIDEKTVAVFKGNSRIPESSKCLSTDISDFAQNGLVHLHFKYNSSTS